MTTDRGGGEKRITTSSGGRVKANIYQSTFPHTCPLRVSPLLFPSIHPGFHTHPSSRLPWFWGTRPGRRWAMRRRGVRRQRLVRPAATLLQFRLPSSLALHTYIFPRLPMRIRICASTLGCGDGSRARGPVNTREKKRPATPHDDTQGAGSRVRLAFRNKEARS